MLKISKQLRRKLERPFWVRFWGRRRKCKPAFVDKALGDGNKLIALTPMDTRPHYYLIRIDSSWSTYNGDETPLCDHLDDIYDAIEDEYGPAEFEGNTGRTVHAPWPAFEFGSGQCWSDAMDLLPKSLQALTPSNSAKETK